jgi:hypothetical protein
MRFGRRRVAGLRLGTLLLAALALLPARATPSSNSPPLIERDTTRETNAFLVENALRSCSRDAIDEGAFELIEIAFAYDTGKPFTPTIKSKRPSLGRPLYWCVERALAKLRLRPTPDPQRPYTQLFGLGEIAPLPKEFLPAWQRALPDPARVKRALGGWLQPEVEVTATGCLHVAGPEVLAGPFLDWHPAGKGPVYTMVNGDKLSPLPGDWWLRERTRRTNADEYADLHEFDARPFMVADDEFCLEHVDPAVSALFRADGRLYQAVNGAAIFDAEWVVDGEGTVAGDIGFCLVPPPTETRREGPYTPDEANVLRHQVEFLLRGLEYPHASSSRQIRVRYDPALGLTVRGVRPADGPLDLAASAVETKCDRRALLRCARTGEANQPSFASVAPLRKCLRESGANAKTISAMFDIMPDGAVVNVKVETTYEDPGRAVPACVQQTMAGLVFPRSEGGACSRTTRMHEILWPPVNQPD